jgi:hypothetical protein
VSRERETRNKEKKREKKQETLSGGFDELLVAGYSYSTTIMTE